MVVWLIWEGFFKVNNSYEEMDDSSIYNGIVITQETCNIVIMTTSGMFLFR